jgi:hypothetical protein
MDTNEKLAGVVGGVLAALASAAWSIVSVVVVGYGGVLRDAGTPGFLAAVGFGPPLLLAGVAWVLPMPRAIRTALAPGLIAPIPLTAAVLAYRILGR